MITMAINKASIRNNISFLATDYFETADCHFFIYTKYSDILYN